MTNSIFTAPSAGLWGAGGGPANCTQGTRDPPALLNRCFADPVFKNNLIIGSTKAWPPGNSTVADGAAAGLRDMHDGKGGVYRLCPKEATPGCKKPSRALGAASDGKDIGADMEAIRRATAGVL